MECKVTNLEKQTESVVNVTILIHENATASEEVYYTLSNHAYSTQHN